MTFIKEDSDPPDPQQRVQQLHLAQLFHGPVQQALAYAYAYAYTQTTDVGRYISSYDLRPEFTDEEFNTLLTSRTAKNFSITLLYKVFRYCCDTTLLPACDKAWACNLSNDKPTAHSPSTLEGHIAALHAQSVAFCSSGAGNVAEVVALSLGVVKCVGEVLNVRQWKQQHDVVKKTVEDILEEVTPGVDVKERVATAGRIESSMRCRAVAGAAARARAAGVAGLEPDDVLKMSDLAYRLTAVAAGKPKAAEREVPLNIAPENILEILNGKCCERIDGKKICCISGEQGVGKSTIAAMFPTSWSLEDNKVKEVIDFDHVLAVSGTEIERTNIGKWVKTKSQRNDLDNFIDEYWSVAEAFLPRCCAKYGVKNVGEMLITQKILFIIDDVDEISEGKVKELILFLGKITFESSVLILGSSESIKNLKLNFVSVSSVQHFHLHGLSKDFLIEKATTFIENTKKKTKAKTFKDSFKYDLNRLAGLFQYPIIFLETFSLWKTNPNAVKDSATASELLWNILISRATRALQVDFAKNSTLRRKWLKWMLVVGDMSLYCLKANVNLNEASMNEIQDAADKLFPKGKAEDLISIFFHKRFVFNIDTFQSIPSSLCKPHLEFLSSFYVVNQISKEESIRSYLPTTNPEALVVFTAGHLKRWHSYAECEEFEGELTLELQQRMIKTLVNYADGMSEDIHFILKIVGEFNCTRKLMQMLVSETEYPDEWVLDLCHLQFKSLKMMTEHVSPARIILKVDKEERTFEQVSVIKYITRLYLSLWLDSHDQFQYGNSKKMDKFIKPFLHPKVCVRCDLIAGYMSQFMIQEIQDYKSMSHLVLLALRVTDEKMLAAAVALPSHMPNLLWFELKIDMDVENIETIGLVAAKVEMFDIYLRDVTDECMPRVTALLSTLHKRYSGIHLDHTNLSPESIYTLLKSLKQKGITLCATADSIDKYRRWYYPQLADMPTGRLLTDKEVRAQLGFEDRRFYSDHKIISSAFVKSIDAWNLTSYLEDLKEIRYFTYKAENLWFTKTLKGKVEIKPLNNTKVNATGEIV